MVFPQTSWDSNTRTEASVRDVIDSILGLNEQMFQFVLGNVGFSGGIEAAEDGGGDGVADLGPGEKVVRRLTVSSSNL